MLWSLMLASLVQIDTGMAEKYAKRYPNNNNQRLFAVSSHSEDMPHDVCVSINGHGDLDL